MKATSFELNIWPDENLVSVIRRFIEEVYERASLTPEAVGRIALTAHELIENAVKYSAGGPVFIRVCMTQTGTVDVEVTNTATDSSIATLREMIAELDAAEDPTLFYYSLIRKNAKRKEGSGLGLARIFAEAEMSLRLTCSQDRVRVSAQTAAEGRPAWAS